MARRDSIMTKPKDARGALRRAAGSEVADGGGDLSFDMAERRAFYLEAAFAQGIGGFFDRLLCRIMVCGGALFVELYVEGKQTDLHFPYILSTVAV